MVMKLSQYAKLNKLTYRTAWNHYKNGWIKCEQLPTGTVLVVDSEASNKPKKYVIYSRVSSSENKNNLEAQADRLLKYCTAKGYNVVDIVKEIGSGLNDSRPKLLSLLKDNNIDVIIVEHKDRLTRFGFNYIQTLLENFNRNIEVVNEVENEKEDIVQDFVSVITSFCARIYGQRRSKRKTLQLLKEIEIEK
jgi:predicted site-specific integrase-resolvase